MEYPLSSSASQALYANTGTCGGRGTSDEPHRDWGECGSEVFVFGVAGAAACSDGGSCCEGRGRRADRTLAASSPQDEEELDKRIDFRAVRVDG